MISSVEEFVALQQSPDRTQRNRIWWDSAPEGVWLQVLEHHPDLKASVAQNPTIPESAVRRLAADQDAALRLVMARRKTLPESLFDDLARDPDSHVREAIARNPSTPATIRMRLAADPDPRVSQVAKEVADRHRQAAARRRSLPKLRGLTIDSSDPGKVGLVVGDDVSPKSFRALLSWLPTDCSLHFWDAEYPSPTDPGAYFVVQRGGGGLIWKMGNHGWSGDWRAISADEVVARLSANRLDEHGGPARIGIEGVWPVRAAHAQTKGRALAPAHRRRGGVFRWIFAAIGLVLVLLGVVMLTSVGALSHLG